jgi:hypothetical protein
MIKFGGKSDFIFRKDFDQSLLFSSNLRKYQSNFSPCLNARGNQTKFSDTNIIGANLLAENINLTVGRNLLVKSKQNLLESDFYSVGANIGISTQSGNSVDGANIGFNMADGFQSKAWVEQLTSIIGTNEVIINTANNTKIVGAEIANIRDGIDYKNLTLNTKSLTFENLKNYNNSESNSLGISLGLGFKDNDPSAPQNSGNNNTQQQTAQNSQATKAEEGVVRGPLKIDLSLHSTESSSTTNATIGKGTITLNGTTLTESEAATNPLLAGLNRNINNTEANKKTILTSDFDASLTVDMRLLAGAFYATKGAITGDATDQAKASNNWNSYVNDTVKGFNLLTSEKAKNIYGKVWASPNTALSASWGLIGVAAGAMMGRDVAITFDHNAIQFEGNPLVDRAFTLGNAINYPAVGGGYGGPEDVLWDSYTGRFYRATVGDHEEPHTYQAEREGPFFIPLYVIDGMMNAKNANPPRSMFSFPGHNGNRHEIEADNHAKTKE